MKIGIVSQARMTSTRLPAKILKSVAGQSLLDYHVDRLQWSALPVYIATTINATDDVVEAFCRKRQIGLFRGSEDNVLSRYAGLAEKYGLDVIVRVTSDCPLIDGHVVRAGVDRFLQLKDLSRSYVTNCQKRTFPRGFDFEVFHRDALNEMMNLAKEPYELEHVTPYIWKSHPDRFRIEHFIRSADASSYRITVDEPDDFKLIEKLIADYACASKNAEEIIRVLQTHPDLALINRHVEQKKV